MLRGWNVSKFPSIWAVFYRHTKRKATLFNFFPALHHQSHSHPRAYHWIKLKSSRELFSCAAENYSNPCLRMIGWKSSGINFSGRAFSERNWPHSDQAHQQQFDRSQMHSAHTQCSCMAYTLTPADCMRLGNEKCCIPSAATHSKAHFSLFHCCDGMLWKCSTAGY